MKKSCLLLLIFLSKHALATSMLSDHNHYKSNKMEWWSASRTQVEEAECRIKTTSADYEKVLSELDNGRRFSELININGMTFQLKNETPQWIQLFKDFISTNSYENKVNETFIKKVLSLKEKTDQCDKALCISKILFGNDIVLPMIYLKYRHGFNTSPLQKPKAILMTKDEINSVIDAVRDFDVFSLPQSVNGNQVLARISLDKGKTIANATIALFDAWGKQSYYQRISTITHELGHYLSNENKIDEIQQWLDFSNWKAPEGSETTLVYSYTSDRDNFISGYSKRNPVEDFAESLVAYRYNAAELKAVAPKKYDYIKTVVFSGREYLDSSCAHQPPLEKSIRETVKDDAQVSSIINDNKTITKEKLIKGCSEDIHNFILKKDSIYLSSCSRSSIQNLVANEIIIDSKIIDPQYETLYLANKKRLITDAGRSIELYPLRETVNQFIKTTYDYILDIMANAYTSISFGYTKVPQEEVLTTCQDKVKYAYTSLYKLKEHMHDQYDRYSYYKEEYKKFILPYCIKINKDHNGEEYIKEKELREVFSASHPLQI